MTYRAAETQGMFKQQKDCQKVERFEPRMKFFVNDFKHE